MMQDNHDKHIPTDSSLLLYPPFRDLDRYTCAADPVGRPQRPLVKNDLCLL
jgi:hypothetical protein